MISSRADLWADFITTTPALSFRYTIAQNRRQSEICGLELERISGRGIIVPRRSNIADLVDLGAPFHAITTAARPRGALCTGARCFPPSAACSQQVSRHPFEAGFSADTGFGSGFCHNVRPVFLEPARASGPSTIHSNVSQVGSSRVLVEAAPPHTQPGASVQYPRRRSRDSAIAALTTLAGQIDNARSVSLAEPRCGIEPRQTIHTAVWQVAWIIESLRSPAARTALRRAFTEQSLSQPWLPHNNLA